MSGVKPSVSDEAVKAKTGQDWDTWFAILDSAGGQNMTHQEIVAYLSEQHGVGPWWQQMVTVTYEQARGLRDKHEMPGGYQISRSKTVGVPVGRLFAAWQDEAKRAAWLSDPHFIIRKSTANKSMRITWVDGETSLEVYFVEKGPEKTQVTVQHSKLPDAEQAEQMKAYWRDALDKMAKHLGN